MGKWQLCGLNMMKNGVKFKHGIVCAVGFLAPIETGALTQMGTSGKNVGTPPV
jgi:hypothetical protein